MHPTVEQLWRQSPQGREVLGAALKQADADEADAKAQLAAHAKARADLFAEIDQETARAEAELAAASEQVRKWRDEELRLASYIRQDLGWRKDGAEKACVAACKPLHEQLKEIARLREDLKPQPR